LSFGHSRAIEKENLLQRQREAKHISDTGQGSEALSHEFLVQPYIDPYTKRWVCPEPVKGVDEGHVDADHKVEDDARRIHPGQFVSDNSTQQNHTLDLENESSNEVRITNKTEYKKIVEFHKLKNRRRITFNNINTIVKVLNQSTKKH